MSMWWMLGAQTGLSFLSSALGGASQARDANLQRANQFEQARLQNGEVSRANRVNLSNAMFNQGLIKMQDSMSRKQLMENKQALGIGQRVDEGQFTLQNNAGGVVGASAEAVVNDIAKKYEDANQELLQQRQLEKFQSDSSIREQYTTYVQNMGKLDESGVGLNPYRNNMGGHFISSLLSVGGSYLERNLTLGLGKKE